jgi:hypothetical protein
LIQACRITTKSCNESINTKSDVLAARKYFSLRIALEHKAEIRIKTAIGTANALIPENIERVDRSQQEKIDRASVTLTVCVPFFEPPYNRDMFASILGTYEHPNAE